MKVKVMKSIVSWNVNGLRAIVKKNFLSWLEQENPDVLCLQETKLQQDQVPEEVQGLSGYHKYFCSAQKKGYSGLALFSKEKPRKIENLNVDEFDNEGRVQLAYFSDYILINTYFPNSQDKGKRLRYKLGFCREIMKACNELTKKEKINYLRRF